MTIRYSEFDTTMGGAVEAIAAKILEHPDWANITPATPATTTNTAATGTTSTSLTWAVNDGSKFVAGDTVIIQPGGANETLRTVVSASATQIVLSGANMPISYPVGTTIRVHSKILSATTTAGAKMILNLYGGPTFLNGFQYDVMASHTGLAGGAGPRRSRYLIWRQSTSGSTSAHAVHVILSVSKEHLYIEVEGPRAAEPGATSTTYGSTRTYMALCGLVSYHAADTVPAWVHVGSAMSTSTGSTGNLSHAADISRDTAGNAWDEIRLASLDFPTVRTTDTVALQRKCSIDGKEYMFPYVVFSVKEGIRGRLHRFFNAGTTGPNAPLDLPDNPGSQITHEGVTYRLRAINKGDGSVSPWNAFGSSSSSTGIYSPVVAVPYATAV